MSLALRLIARLDVKGPNLIKPVQLEGVRKVGDPKAFAGRYYEQGIDEILYMDAVASLYDRETLVEIVRHTAERVFVPITVGGGLRTIDDVREILRAGADKVAINSEATRRPQFITEVAQTFGSQCMVLQIDAKADGKGKWEAYRDGGREHTGLDAVAWAIRGCELGAGEILATGIDHEGMRRGFDIDLTRQVSEAVPVPVIASGGMGALAHLVEVAEKAKPNAVAMAHVLHYGEMSLGDVRSGALDAGLPVRRAFS
ncbi:imidazole glycerol phosphate synthase subunit HisF [Magnetospira sp. QH-2]|uniref:imidazole glycerol phosphate synthase subunit HisF n=1 Tax=Magnetospira sp. (strain QH-2) TaxID=1288970 RepID=UPI0003E8112A|nr:imidazole glycerol phosphate synthase cyclase subunit [Magnetospira sp. QH-2]CCQ73585.1 Imidazole glycerol phosphate synthase subunit hisF [Magnetospira sp. QH-2]